MDIKVSIYERIKGSDGWHERYVPPPRLFKGGSVPKRLNRKGTFIISWYEHRKKKRQPVEGHTLEAAVMAARGKAYWLNARRGGVQVVNPTRRIALRLEIAIAIEDYLKGKAGCAKTLSAHRLALREFKEFAASENVEFIDEMDAALLRRWYEDLIEDGDNVPFTAANKLLKVNSFFRAITGRPPGQGLIRKRDYKRELASTGVVEIYTRDELTALFSHMDPDEHLLFSTIKEAALRKKEAMYLEASDLRFEQLTPDFRKCEIAIQSKPRWNWMTKTGQDRNIVISPELMDRLIEHSAAARPSTLLFRTSQGLPDYHMLDKLKAIGKKAGLDPTRLKLHMLRATTATHWLRSKDLGGMGRDIAVVRQQLGHSDYKSIEAYIALVKNEELAYKEHIANGNVSPNAKA